MKSIGMLGRVCLAVFVMAMSPAIAAAQEPLRILLTSDDGWESPGTQAMKTALDARGHLVTLVAPSTNASGSGAGLSLSGIAVVEQAPGVYSVAGSPATSVLIGMALMSTPPDLIVVGVNDDFNGGPLSIHSGSLGATMTGLSRGIPSITVMTTPDPADPDVPAHFATVASFAARLIDDLQSATGTQNALLPDGVGLKVGYPGLPASQIRGVTLAEQGDFGMYLVNYRQAAPGLFVPQLVPTNPADADPRGDVSKYLDGFITILPIRNDMTAAAPNGESLRQVVNRIKP